MRVIYYSDKPTLSTSFALQSDLVASYLASHGHEVHYIVPGETGGKPVDYHGYKIHPGNRIVGRSTKNNLFNLMKEIDPHVLISMFDVHQTVFMGNMPRDHVWIAYYPIDTEILTMDLLRAVAKPDVKVVQTMLSARMLVDRGIKRVLYIPCAVDTDSFFPMGDKASIRRELGVVDEDDFVILFVGRPNWRKNVPTIMMTMDRLVNRHGLDHVKLLMHTDLNDPAMATNISQWIVATGLQDHVTFTNPAGWDVGVDKERLNMIYNMADVYFQPHAGEGFGITMAEAMACGLPVVATGYTSSREMIGKDKRGLRIPYSKMISMMGVKRPIPDTDSCVEALLKYINGEIDARKQGRAAAKFARKNYAARKVLSSWLALVNSLEYNRVKSSAITGGGWRAR